MNIISHQNIEESTKALSAEIAFKLQVAVQRNGIAKLLVSGGRSPIPLFEQLSKTNIDWDKVIIGLVDERFVDAHDEASNEKLIRETLLHHQAKDATFIGLIYDLTSNENNLDLAKQLYATFATGIDVCVLGMGTDGHTASLFPNDPISQTNLTTPNQELLLYTSADVEPYQRITCSKSLLNCAENLYLLMSGENKLKVLQNATAAGLPIAHFFKTQRTNLLVHYNKN